MINILFILIIILSPTKLLLEDEQILFSFQMIRHGARAPYDGVKNGEDKYKELWISESELTEIGKRMLYLLGVKYRKRYMIDNSTKFLNEYYSPQEIYIKSTDNNRTIESIYSYLQGLYPKYFKKINEKVKNSSYPPNKKYQNKFEEILDEYDMKEKGSALPYNINIVPIHLFYKVEHDFDLYDEELCPYRYEISNKSHKSEIVLNFVDKIINNTNNLFMDLEPSNSSSFLYDYWTLYKYMDGFFCDDFDKRNFNYIKNKYGENIIKLLRNYSKEFLDMNYFDISFPESDRDVGLVSSSLIMNDILNWMENAKNLNENKIDKYLKFVIYSAHDSSIGALDHFMRTALNSSVEECNFACSRVFELYKRGNEFFVRYLKGDNSIKFNVTYTLFRKKVLDIIWDNNKIKDYCKYEENKEKNEEKKEETVEKGKGAAYHIMIILIIFDIILIIVLIAYCRHKRF